MLDLWILHFGLCSLIVLQFSSDRTKIENITRNASEIFLQQNLAGESSFFEQSNYYSGARHLLKDFFSRKGSEKFLEAHYCTVFFFLSYSPFSYWTIMKKVLDFFLQPVRELSVVEATEALAHQSYSHSTSAPVLDLPL